MQPFYTAILRSTFTIVLACCGLLSLIQPVVAQSRVLGLDVSRWQGTISQTTWNNIHNVENRDFVFIRSTRGGTTGIDKRQGGFPSNDNVDFNLSQRYDDPYFVRNITRATNAGLYAGPYHFGRHDIIASTPNSGGIANTGTDEANHFIDMAGAWMRPGYLMPVFDLEGPLTRTSNELAQFSIDFSNRVHEVMGIRPTMYINGSYSQTLQAASSSLRDQIVESYPNLWDARYAYQLDPDSAEVQTAHPKDTFNGFYGPWDDAGVTHPWTFWQYASSGRLQSFNNGNSNLDFNVAQGGTEFLKDNLVPALWTSASDGQWTTLANWNSGQAPIAPVQGPGQLPRAGSLTLPAVRLPSGDDTVILDRANEDVTVTLSSGIHNIRKLVAREALNLTGGILVINYVPSADSTPNSAQFSAPVMLDGGSLSVHTLQVDATETFSIGGSLVADTIQLMPDASTPAKIELIGDISFTPLAGAAALVTTGAGAGNLGQVDLGGANRTWNISDDVAAIDLELDVPVTNGGITKSGAGTLALSGTGALSGDTVVVEGALSVGSTMLDDAADVLLSGTGVLDLDFNGTPDVVNALWIDGVPVTAGIWGSPTSGAPLTSPLLSGTGTLQVSTSGPPPTGDFNADGFVDGFDFLYWQGNGMSGSDLMAWEANYGSSPSLEASAAAVPEPSTIALSVVLAAMGLAGRRRI